MTSTASREIHLASRPEGMPRPENFALVERQIPAPSASEVLVRNLFMSVDPYMRGRMMDRKSYVPPFRLGEVLEGSAVGEVVVGMIASAGRPGAHQRLANMRWRRENDGLAPDTGLPPSLPGRARNAGPCLHPAC
jgi:hypothetical protein